MFQYYQYLGPSPRRNGAGSFDFVPGALSRDTELKLFGKSGKMHCTKAGDDRQSLTELTFHGDDDLSGRGQSD